MICPNCGKANREGAAFCDSCGTRLEAPEAPPTAEVLPSAGGGRYVARAFLGEGGRKRVFRAFDTRLEREVALSLIKTAGLDEASIERVRREAKAMARLGDHPNIVKIFDVGEEEEVIFLVAELMPGGSIEEQLNRSAGPLPIERVLGIARDVGSALEHIHEQGVVHRDIKPANVWLSREGTSKLGDFGLAAGPSSSKLTTEGMMLGTVAYMAPEQATGGEVDARSDLYSFGALLYEAATGKPPFAGDDAIAVISQQIGTAPVAPTWHNPQIPPGLEHLILDLLAKSPEDRPQGSSEVLARLDAVAGEAAEPRSAVQENPMDRLASGVFVGREAESRELRLMFDQARRGSGGLALLVGEPGIGKTRMSEELITFARMNGAQVLTGRCYEGEGAPAYWPWIQVIRSSLHDRTGQAAVSNLGSGAGYIAQIVPDVRQLVPDAADPASSDLESSRFQLFDSVTIFLRNTARSQPIVVFLDDMHWADKPSLLLLEFLSRQLRDSPILVICTYRDIELGRQHPLAQTLASVIREPNTRRILLRGLTRDDVARYIKLTVGREPADSLVDAILMETEGNPFFIIETVRLLAVEGRLEATGQRSWSITIPQGVKEVIGRRLDMLSEECNQVLTLASVLGREFDLSMIELLSSLPADTLLEALDEAVGARVLTDESGGKYRFDHALIRETLYDELSTAKRLRLHKLAAGALETLSKDDADRYLSELAHHYFEASALGGVEKAILYARRAGDQAMSQLAFEEAAAQYDRALQALELADSGQEETRCEILLALGRANISSGETAEALKAFREAFKQAGKGGFNDLLARAALGLGDVLTDIGSVSQELIDALEEALAAQAGRETSLRVSLLARLGEAYGFDEATQDREEELTSEALALARRLGDPRAIAHALYARFIGLGEARDTESQIEQSTELIENAARAGDIELRLLGLRLRMTFLFHTGRLAEARKDVAEYARLAEGSKLALYGWFSPLFQSTWTFAEGKLDLTADLIERALSAGTKAGEPNVERFSLPAVLSLAVERKDIERILWVLEKIRAPGESRWYWAPLIFATLAAGEQDEARRLLNQVVETRFEGLSTDWGLLWMLGLLAETCRRLDDAASSRVVYERATPFADRFGVPGYLIPITGYGHHYLGVLATIMKRYDDAQEHLDAALKVHEDAGFEYLATQTRLAQARLLYARESPGDEERCRALVNRVVEVSSHLGFAQTLQDAVELRLKLQGIDPGDTLKSIHAIAAEVRREQPSLSEHASPDGTVTIMFTDIEGSTELNETLGDQRWLDLLTVHDRIIREQVASAGGTVVKSRGDGFMLAFPSARHALAAAMGAQKALSRHNGQSPQSTPIRVRIGVHTGEVVRQRGDFFGRHVNFASRIADQARGGEILVSDLTKALVQGSLEFRFGAERTAALKGFPGTHPMFPLDWTAPPAG